MRFSRKLFMLATASLLFLASGTSPASASPNVEFIGADDLHCPPIVVTGDEVSGGCEADIAENTHIELLRHIPGIGEVVVQACAFRYSFAIDENGEGYIHHVRLFGTSESANCGITATPCDMEEDGAHELWAFHIYETGPAAGDEMEHAIQRWCLRVLTGVNHGCEIEGNVEQQLTEVAGKIVSSEAEGTGDGVSFTSRVVHSFGGQTHATCEGLGASLEVRGHWNINTAARIAHQDDG